MDNDIIKIEERNGQQAVNARELHEALGNKQRFADWIKNRIEKYGFIVNQDFEVFHNSVKNPISEDFDKLIRNSNNEVFNNSGENPKGGRPTIDYALSLDMAKELAMVENNDKGRKIRQYFIEKEKEARNKAILPQNFAQALYLAAQQQEELDRRQKLIEAQTEQVAVLTNAVAEMQEKVSYVDHILKSKETVTVTQIAQDYGMSAKALNKKLAGLGIQRKVNKQWILYAKHLTHGYVQSKSVDITRTNGMHDTIMNTEWTQKGRIFLYHLLKDNNIIPLIEQ